MAQAQTIESRWPNPETEVMADWIDQTSHEHAHSLAKRAAGDAWDDDRPDEKNVRIADALRAWQQDQLPQLEDAYADLLESAFDKIDWSSIANGYLEEQERGCGCASGRTRDN
jgi:hypothetical protein